MPSFTLLQMGRTSSGGLPSLQDDTLLLGLSFGSLLSAEHFGKTDEIRCARRFGRTGWQRRDRLRS